MFLHAVMVLFQRDFEIRELRDLQKQVMKLMGEALQNHSDIAQSVNVYFTQVNIMNIKCIVHVHLVWTSHVL